MMILRSYADFTKTQYNWGTLTISKCVWIDVFSVRIVCCFENWASCHTHTCIDLIIFTSWKLWWCVRDISITEATTTIKRYRMDLNQPSGIRTHICNINVYMNFPLTYIERYVCTCDCVCVCCTRKISP